MDILNSLNQYAQLINFVLLLGILGLLVQVTIMYRANLKEQISTLKEENNLLNERLTKMESESPLAVTESIKKRLQFTEEEFKRLEGYAQEQVETIAQYKALYAKLAEIGKTLGEEVEKLPVELNKVVEEYQTEWTKATIEVLARQGLLKADYLDNLSESDNK